MFSLWGSSFSSILFPQGHLDKKARMVQHPSEPLKGHGILWDGAKSLKTRCRCGVASNRGMGGDLREEKTRFSPISSTQSCTTLSDMQPQSCTVTSVERQFISQRNVLLLLCWHGRTIVPWGQQRSGEGKGRVAYCSEHWKGLWERIWIGTWLSWPMRLLVTSVIPPPLRWAKRKISIISSRNYLVSG